ncbi:hypothetical protein SCLCIDRAFT_1081599 [Scleroderma citrinum Foug A]|uniref:MARVEL domain-containing protein n=1 Tax=Scleroderma citrinum Foug A TaxID=1036808 RepID=A0A0C3A2V1_9AGAM|nr:hypothetical protein SCLCIDRAFT_1081599 [Scleroderma citrinum Foug A]
MTVLFTNLRIAAYLIVFAFSTTVLGIACNFAKLFLPHVQHDFTIFSLVAPSVTILSLLFLLQFAQPVIEVVAHALVGILWLTMAAWTSDIIGPTQCYQLGSATTPTNNGSMSARSYCYQMKVIEAFSWATFIAFFGFVVVVISLTSRAVAFGRRFAWQEHISQLGWYGEWPGFPTEAIYPRPYYPGQHPYYPHMGGNYINQMPGHSVVIQPGMGGGMPMISQVPGAIA